MVLPHWHRIAGNAAVVERAGWGIWRRTVCGRGHGKLTCRNSGTEAQGPWPINDGGARRGWEMHVVLYVSACQGFIKGTAIYAQSRKPVNCMSFFKPLSISLLRNGLHFSRYSEGSKNACGFIYY